MYNSGDTIKPPKDKKIKSLHVPGLVGLGWGCHLRSKIRVDEFELACLQKRLWSNNFLGDNLFNMIVV